MNLDINNLPKFSKTPVPPVPKTEERKWYFLDLKNRIPGRVATKIAILLRGKHEKLFFPNLDLGSNIVLINASELYFTGNKLDNEYYYNHSGYPGKPRKRSVKEMLKKHSTELMWRIVWGMMPKNNLSRKQMTRLHIFSDEKHDKQAQEKKFNTIEISKKSKKN